MKRSTRLSISFLLWLITVFFVSCLPKAPQYPFRQADTLVDEARVISDQMDTYVHRWLNGEVPATLPDSIIPDGVDRGRFKNMRLVKPEDITPEQQWGIRKAGPIDPDSLMGAFPDPNCTYLVVFNAFVPFGHRIVIEGDFPYSRFMSVQFTPSFHGTAYRYGNYAGVGEVGYLDADIHPKPGNINPFIPGNNRLATNRAYRVVFESATGFPHQLNKEYRPPNYRVTDTVCYGSGIQCHGPWGLNKRFGHGRGIWDMGEIWMRYYGIDDGRGPLGGVDLPKVHYETQEGEKYFIACDLEVVYEQVNTIEKMRETKGRKGPNYSIEGPYRGWNKQFDIFLVITQGLSMALKKTDANHKAYIRKLQLGVTGRSGEQPAPNHFEPHATGCLYAKYLLTSMTLKRDHVFVLTGKLPTFPDTRHGATTLDTAQCRYWSITGYDSHFPFTKTPGLAVSSVMDDEVVTDAQGRYIIVYSRPDDRPENATSENGITWVNWGTTGTQTLNLRWFDIGDKWTMPLAPNEENLPWPKASYTGSQYNPNLVGRNTHQGFMKEYLPKRHYMKLEEFEALGQRKITWDDIPDWTY